MTQLEILNLAGTMICLMIEKEERIAEEVKREYGHEDEVAKLRIERYTRQYREIGQMILAEENK